MCTRYRQWIMTFLTYVRFLVVKSHVDISISIPEARTLQLRRRHVAQGPRTGIYLPLDADASDFDPPRNLTFSLALMSFSSTRVFFRVSCFRLISRARSRPDSCEQQVAAPPKVTHAACAIQSTWAGLPSTRRVIHIRTASLIADTDKGGLPLREERWVRGWPLVRLARARVNDQNVRDTADTAPKNSRFHGIMCRHASLLTLRLLYEPAHSRAANPAGPTRAPGHSTNTAIIHTEHRGIPSEESSRGPPCLSGSRDPSHPGSWMIPYPSSTLMSVKNSFSRFWKHFAAASCSLLLLMLLVIACRRDNERPCERPQLHAAGHLDERGNHDDNTPSTVTQDASGTRRVWGKGLKGTQLHNPEVDSILPALACLPMYDLYLVGW